MRQILSLLVLAAGIVLLVQGINDAHTLGSQLTRFFTGSQTSRVVGMQVGGVAAILAGLLGMFWRGKNKRRR